jgi:exodeoxyribonuclease-3
VVSLVQVERPDVLCLQELKATVDQIPEALSKLDEYWSCWHGSKGYSGVSIHVRKELAPERPRFWHPEFDHETRIVVADIHGVFDGISVASIYVPNGGRDYRAKIGFLDALAAYASSARLSRRGMLLCGDLNVARAEIDVHPRQRDPRMVGQRPEERALFERILEEGALRDVGRQLEPDNTSLYTWWAPWRNLRQLNVGWRLDYILASSGLAGRAIRSTVLRESGTSDHGAVIVELSEAPAQTAP